MTEESAEWARAVGASVRRDPELAEPYRKDPTEERFLEQLNQSLAPAQEASWRDIPERYPTLHVIGVPRSGTTLMTQLLANHLEVGYVNNLIAAFWLAPTFGIRLSRKLLKERPTGYESEFGRTRRIEEPHEFGYFWAQLLGYDEFRERDPAFETTIDWKRVRTVMTNIADAFDAPVVFKSPLLGWHIRTMLATLPRTCFLRICRDPTDNALSLLDYRRKFLGSEERWVSLKPRAFEVLQKQPYWRQVAGQVYHLDQGFSARIAAAGSPNVLDIEYAELCRNPRGVLSRVRLLLEQQGSKVSLVGNPPESFPLASSAGRDDEEYRQVKRAVAELYGQ